jgi:hypothetical protein
MGAPILALLLGLAPPALVQRTPPAPPAIAPASNASTVAKVAQLTPAEIDRVIKRLRVALANYIFPGTAARIERELTARLGAYRILTSKTELADRLTGEMRTISQDQHLSVTVDEELGVRKSPTAAEEQHVHDFDRANAFGMRSARRLPGNIGYIDLAYFSPDPDAGTAVAAAMQMVSGTDALIIDLRRNGGGSGETERTLASYFFADEVQLSSIFENVSGKQRERQHWTLPYVQGPHYLSKPVYILIGRHTHSAAEAFAYDLHNLGIAKIVGEHTSGDATSSTGEVDLGYGLTALIPNGQLISPMTHGNYFRVGVLPEKSLVAAYGVALTESTPTSSSAQLEQEKVTARNNPAAALSEEIDGFSEHK